MVALFTCSLKLLLCLLVSGSRLIALFIGSLKLVLCLLVSRCAHAMASFVTLRQLFLFFFFPLIANAVMKNGVASLP